MRIDELKELCINIYQDFYREVTMNSDYDVRITDNDRKTLEKFLEFYINKFKIESIGAVFLVGYVEFSFDFWRGIKTKFGAGIVYFNWIFGKKGIERFEKWDKVVHTRNIRKDISRKVLAKYGYKEKSKEEFNDRLLNLSEFEESEKQRYKNTEEGFFWCVQNTTLYNHKSPICLSCKFSIDCKNTLKENYLKLFRKRGYDE